jgi:murein DD-endopeptidase MepM/ murein hydrolase activator NlpD
MVRAHARGDYVVSQAQTVRNGQLIGYMGSTGFALGTPLPLEVWQGGDWDPVSPRLFL